MLSRVLLPVSILVTVGYLLGCLPIANSIARRHGIADLRMVGDQNPGYWNARSTLGVRAARPILVGDTLKGVVAALVGLAVSALADGPWWWVPLAGGAAMLGHAAPATDGFRGGRSVLTFVGSSLVFAPVAASVALALAGTIRSTTGRTDQASRVGVAVFPVVQLAIDGPERTLATGVLMTFVGIRFLTARVAG